MRVRIVRVAAFWAVWLVSIAITTQLYAAAGTSMVATAGQPAYVQSTWPEGVNEIVNDAARTDGWNDWFSKWPNDVHHYAFRVENTADINRLIKKLAAVKSELRQIHLSPMEEPRGLGWVTSLPEGNDTAVIFSIGDQQGVDQWYGQISEGKFGVMTFKAAPVAVPPTLTIFVGNDVVDLEKLVIREDVEITMGSCPRYFHKWNTDLEAEQLREKACDPDEELKSLDETERKVADQIMMYLKERKSDK